MGPNATAVQESSRATQPGGRPVAPARTELLLSVVPQEQQFRVKRHLTEVLGCLPPGFLFFLSPRRWRFGQKPIFLLEAAQDENGHL